MGSFSSLSIRDVLHLTLKGEGLSTFFEDMDLWANSKGSTYSEVDVNLQKLALSISENFTMLSFSEHEGSSLLHNASWGALREPEPDQLRGAPLGAQLGQEQAGG